MKTHLLQSQVYPPNLTGPARLFVVALLGAGLLTGCSGLGGSAKVTSTQTVTTAPQPKPTVIYIQDFDLLAENIQNEPGLLGSGRGRQGPIRRRLSGTDNDPAARARELVNLMANSLLKDLNKAGFSAVRLESGAPLPTQGWLLRGVFNEVQEGNRLQRAMIGFGVGKTDLQVVTGLDNLAKGPPKPLYTIDTEATSSKMPGAAPTIVLGPWGATARFVMAGQDLDKNVEQTAASITAEITKHLQAASLKSDSPPGRLVRAGAGRYQPGGHGHRRRGCRRSAGGATRERAAARGGWTG
jgi:Domain of unknown function (DUF4410)